jgi:hypothetical protein
MYPTSQEGRILLAFQAIQKSKKNDAKPMSIHKAAQTFSVPHTTLHRRMMQQRSHEESRVNKHKLDAIEEQTLVRYIIDQDARGFPLRLSGVEDMANLLLASRDGKPVGKHWARRFVDMQPSLKTRFDRPYDYQRALCEDPEVIGNWFRLLSNMMAKYRIIDDNLYNCDETGFMMGMITASMVVTRADRRGKAKSVQPGNREWATVIECINVNGWCIPPFVIVQAAYHLASWTTESGFPPSWVIAPTQNGWTDNKTGLEWIQHFNKHTKPKREADYRMLILDGHESHMSAEFNQYCKDNKIIPISMPPHSSHLVQPLDVALFRPLKHAYGGEISNFIRASINHITKSEFFIAFKAAHNKTFTGDNIKAAFRGAGIVPWDPDSVISKLDVRIRTPVPSVPVSPQQWESQTPSNAQQTVKQSSFIKGRISAHQGSSPTPIMEAVDRMAKGAQAMAHSITLMSEQIRTLQEANKTLAKRRKAKRTRVQLGGALSIEESQVIIKEKEKGKRPAGEISGGAEEAVRGGPSKRRCGNCGETGHNARTCEKEEEGSEGSDSDCIIADPA